MKAESFYRLGAALGLSQSGMEALLNGGEPPIVEETRGDFVHVMINPRDAVPGYAGIPVQVRRSTIEKWVKELNRLRNEEAR